MVNKIIIWKAHGVPQYNNVAHPNSRVTFKAQLKVGWQPKSYIESYIPNCWSYPEVFESARNNWTFLVRANSMSNMKNSAKKAKKGKMHYYLLLFYQSLLKWEEILYS